MVFQPQVPVIVGKEIVSRDGHGIGIRCSGVAGKQEQVTGEGKRGPAAHGYFHVTYFHKLLPCECLRCADFLFRQLEVAEEIAFGMSLLVGDAAYLLQKGKVMAHGLQGLFLLIEHIVLKIPDEPLVKLPEGDILRLESLTDEPCENLPCVVILGVCSLGTVDTYTRFQVLVDAVKLFQQGHLLIHAPLKHILDCRSVKLLLALQQRIKCGIDGKQQFLNLGVGFNRLFALAVQTAFTGIP